MREPEVQVCHYGGPPSPHSEARQMVICAHKDASDEEILEVCNRDNPSNNVDDPWCSVVRYDTRYPVRNPTRCEDDGDYYHFLVNKLGVLL